MHHFCQFSMAAGGQNGDFQTFVDFENFNCIFENNSLKALFGQNMKKVKILTLSPDFRYLQKLALKLNLAPNPVKPKSILLPTSQLP